MKADVLVGLQWGDEGKTKMGDFLSADYDVVARFHGGPNSKHILPPGVASVDKTLVLGNGMAIAPDRFMDEIKTCEAMGAKLNGRLLISRRAQIIMPSHRLLDEAYDSNRAGRKIATSAEGVGPAYSDKVNRLGLCVGDIQDGFAEKFAIHKAQHEATLRSLHVYSSYDIKDVESKWLEGIECMRQFDFVDTEYEINKMLNSGKKILCTGSRGTMLDIDFGSYPHVTSCNTVSAAACTGLGISPNKVGEVYGVFKAFSTRVGRGPLPTELFDSNSKKMRDKALEVGSGTIYERRTGWIDLVALKYAIMLNGVTKLVITKCDALDDLETIKACIAYKKDTEYIDFYPYGIKNDEVEPIFVEMQGWKQDTSEITSSSELPEAFVDYLRFLEKELKLPIYYASVGPGRRQTIKLR